MSGRSVLTATALLERFGAVLAFATGYGVFLAVLRLTRSRP
jgi:hypothetical protein